MRIPRIMLAAPSSGSGKTLITCGILQALVNRGMNVASFKCGPDFIDPMFHERVIGTRSGNIDMFMAGRDTARYLFCRSAKDSDISVIEGVMGFYDGMGIASTEASSYDVSSELDIPVILVVNGRGASASIVPMIKGFADYRKNNIRGVILNNTSEKVCEGLRGTIEKETGITVIGYVPKVKELVIESRHMGLVMPHEVDMLKEKLNDLSEILERTLDIDAVVRIAGSSADIAYDAPVIERIPAKVRVAVAADECFCFLYKENVELLERLGAEITYFSPLRGKGLPAGISGIIIPGGYPELYAESLSRNTEMLTDIRRCVSGGMPCMAEGGGFLYLHDELEDNGGEYRKMAGAVSGKAFRTGKISKFGYLSVTARNDGLMEKGTTLRGHEFHYWDSTDCGGDCDSVKPSGAAQRCMHNEKNMFAGFPHLYYYSNPDAVRRFLTVCGSYRKG
ncbi:MAG: cobyrinate a,c-diamide synthase [Methanomassiliicoccaceae archaeon]|jgi:cobyrinic acid a,c-diamide synthase|nr:cobyrinate a,c-diamide synthase [Methanomassiliicoccaceae archaeon]